ncbi:MAG: TIR domain-containing protein, partial [Clostridia bacterium]|nr:TIR domain-containing protein [Clostridia bacterium]
RDGGDMAAMYFYRALKDRGYRVFYDLEALRSGSFDEALLRSIHSCTDFVLILSPHALDRCVNPDDWVRAEIAEALRLGKNIIPIMLKDFTFPDYLPEDIDAVRYQNGLTSTTEYFNESINRVCSRYLLSKPVERKKKPSPVVPILLSLAAVLLLAAGLMTWFMDKPDSTRDTAPAETVLPVETEQVMAVNTPPYVETAVPTDLPYVEVTPTPVQWMEATPVPQNVVIEVPPQYLPQENSGNSTADTEIRYDTPVPLYTMPVEYVTETYTEVPVYTQEPQPIITPLPLVTPVQQQTEVQYPQDIYQEAEPSAPENQQADVEEVPIQPQATEPVMDIFPTDTPVPLPETEGLPVT